MTDIGLGSSSASFLLFARCFSWIYLNSSNFFIFITNYPPKGKNEVDSSNIHVWNVSNFFQIFRSIQTFSIQTNIRAIRPSKHRDLPLKFNVVFNSVRSARHARKLKELWALRFIKIDWISGGHFSMCYRIDCYDGKNRKVSLFLIFFIACYFFRH